MDVLKNKSYKSYSKLSRYAIFPYYYNSLDNKNIYGTTAWLDDRTTYSIHNVVEGDTLDKLALYYYNNPTYYWIIADFNRITDPLKKLEKGISLKIPSISTIEFME